MMRNLLILVLFLFSGPISARAGVVHTFGERLEGKVTLHEQHVMVNDKKIAWDDVVYALPDHDGKRSVQPLRMHLKNGETWAVDFTGMDEKNLEVRSDLFGKKKIPLELVARLDFDRCAQLGPRKAGVLYRTKGEPIPGKLLGITPEKIKIDSPVGELELPRLGLASFSFTEERTARGPNLDEVVLMDGSRLRGKFGVSDKNWTLEHATLGKLTFPISIVRSVARYSDRVFDLVEAKPNVVPLTPKDLKSTPDEAPHIQQLDPFAEDDLINGLRFEPNVTVEYRLPRAGTKSGKLRAILMPVSGAAGDVKIEISVAGKVVLEREVTPRTKRELIAIDVAAGETLVITASYGSTLRFPSGVIFGDPHVVWQDRGN